VTQDMTRLGWWLGQAQSQRVRLPTTWAVWCMVGRDYRARRRCSPCGRLAEELVERGRVKLCVDCVREAAVALAEVSRG
jgi:hypothetical protein